MHVLCMSICFKSPWVDTSIVKYYPLVEMMLAYRVGDLNVCGRVGGGTIVT